MEIAQALNIKTIERHVELKELIKAEEAFVTNSIMELMPLTWLEGKPIGSGKPGELTKKMQAVYKKLVNQALQ